MRTRIFFPRRPARWVRWTRRVTAALALIAMLAMPRAAHAADRDSCAQAASGAEAEYGLPAGLLAAIGRVETGRYSPRLGAVAPWPWAVDVAGTGALFPNRDEALAVAQGAFAAGQRNIDLGCFQVNLAAHPSAFASIAEAMDPIANARYAARFLVSLHARLGDWAAAAAAYHSETATLGMPYLRAVLRSWSGGAAPGAIPAAFGAPSAPTGAGWVVISPVANGPMPGPRIITPETLAASGVVLPAVHAGWPAGLAR